MPDQLSPSQSPAPKDAELLRASIAEYLARERAASVRHELYYREITGMPGGTFEHGNIGVDFLIALAFLLRAIKSACEVHGADQKIFIEPGVFYYPDFSVVCGSPQVDFNVSPLYAIIFWRTKTRRALRITKKKRRPDYGRRFPSLQRALMRTCRFPH